MAYFKDKKDGSYIADKPFGDLVEITKDEYNILNPPKTLTELNAESNAIILSQIVELEAQQARPIREIALGDTTYAVTKLQSLNNQIAALRAQLV